MKVLLAFYGDETRREGRTREDYRRVIGAWQAFEDAAAEAGVFVVCDALEAADTTTTLRYGGGRREITDGPYIETKEQLGGVIGVLDVRDLDEALEWADKTPWIKGRMSVVEIRPVMDYEAYATRASAALEGRAVVLSAPLAVDAVDRLFREQFGRAVAALIRATADWDLAEDAVQHAFTVALARWPCDGVPVDALAWIVTVARNQAIDRVRRDRALATRAPELIAGESHDERGGSERTHDHARQRRASASDVRLLSSGASEGSASRTHSAAARRPLDPGGRARVSRSLTRRWPSG